MESWFYVLVLGVIQGLAEFLPVSSSGHLALAQMLFGIRGASLTLNVVLHAGTLMSMLIYFRGQIARIISESARAVWSPRSYHQLPGAQDAWTIVLASIPTAILGLTFRDTVERWTASPTAVGIGFVITTLLLLSVSDRMLTRHRPSGLGREHVPWSWALMLGVAQGIAITPGISRSGATIAVALWLGLRTQRAFDLSMLMSLPAVGGAFLLETRHLSETSSGPLELIFGGWVAAAVGLVALAILRRLVVRGHMSWFALWVFPLACATLIFARAWPG